MLMFIFSGFNLFGGNLFQKLKIGEVEIKNLD